MFRVGRSVRATTAGFAVLAGLGGAAALADEYEWTNQGTNWNDTANWENVSAMGAGLIPSTASDRAIVAGSGPTAGLSSDITLGMLSIEEGGRVRTGTGGASFELDVADQVDVTGTGSSLTVRESGNLIDMSAHRFHASGGGELILDGGAETMLASVELDVGGTLRGSGQVLVDGSAEPAGGVSNDGAIVADGALVISRFGDAVPFDLDGPTDAGRLEAAVSSSLRIGSPAVGGPNAFAGTATIAAAASIELASESAGPLDWSGSMQFTGPTDFPGIYSGDDLLLSGGSISGNGDLRVDVDNTGGQIEPGNAAGRLTVDHYAQSDPGELVMEVGGTSPAASHDQLVADSAELGGGIRISFISGYTPPTLPDASVGGGAQRFHLIDTPELTGTFDSVHGLDLPGFLDARQTGRELRLVYVPDEGVYLEAFQASVGDANLDGLVDVRDLGTLADNWQSTGSFTDGDFTGDGLVDASDLGLLADFWQAGAEPLNVQHLLASLDAGVPEPASVAGLTLGALALLARRR